MINYPNKIIIIMASIQLTIPITLVKPKMSQKNQIKRKRLKHI